MPPRLAQFTEQYVCSTLETCTINSNFPSSLSWSFCQLSDDYWMLTVLFYRLDMADVHIVFHFPTHHVMLTYIHAPFTLAPFGNIKFWSGKLVFMYGKFRAFLFSQIIRSRDICVSCACNIIQYIWSWHKLLLFYLVKSLGKVSRLGKNEM